jgi:hypothetical protein
VSGGTATFPATTTEGVVLGARKRTGARFFYFDPGTLYLLVGERGPVGPNNYTVKLGAACLVQWDLPAGNMGPVRAVWTDPQGVLTVCDF